MKIKNKGKVYPSPSDGDHLSVLKLLPAAILALASVLSLEDRQVLAYLITRSIKTTAAAAANASSSVIRGKASRKAAANGSSNSSNGATHKPPMSDCDCFDCYTSYWFRWDSSPNRELIHQAIEAFEDHLTNGESANNPNTNKKKYGKAKRRDKTARRLADNNINVEQLMVEETVKSSVADEILPEDGVAVAPVSSVKNEVVPEVSGDSTFFAMVEEEVKTAPVFSSPPAAADVCSCCSQHKGLARKVLPDVLGLLNSRLWSLWSPNA